MGISRPSIPRVVALALSALAAAGCLPAKASVAFELELPALPPEWIAAFGEMAGEVRLRDPTGAEDTILLSPWSEGATGLEVELTPGAYAAVLVTPVAVGSDIRMRPAGAVFPLDAEAGGARLCSSWERGCAAWVLAKLLEGTDQGCLDPGDLDFERIARLISDRGDGDPWRVDTSALLDSIAGSPDGTPTCRLLPTLEVRIPAADLPRGTGAAAAPTYVLDDPLFGPIGFDDHEGDEEGDGGELRIESLPTGFHRLFASDPGTGWLDLLVSEREAVWIGHEARSTP